MRVVLADDLTASVTNAEGGIDQVAGGGAYPERLLALNTPPLSATVTQSVTVAPDRAPVMVEIRAERKGNRLHNFAAFLGAIRDDQVSELWKVEALPAYSDEFWQ
jgi:hypothetical protein